MATSFGINEFICFPGDEHNESILFGEEDFLFDAEFIEDSLSYLDEPYMAGTSAACNVSDDMYETKNNNSFASEISVDNSCFDETLLGGSVSGESSFAVSSPAYVTMEEIDTLFRDENLVPADEEKACVTSFSSLLANDAGLIQNCYIEELGAEATIPQNDSFAARYNFDLDLGIQELQDQDCLEELSELPQEIVVATPKISPANIIIETPAAKTPKAVKRAKRPKPQFMISDLLFRRINSYWSIVSRNEKYLITLSVAVNRWASSTIIPLSAEQFINNVVPALLPNYVRLSFFKDVQGKEGWYYEKNKKRQGGSLALRWCGQELNFYDPFIIRYQMDDAGKPTNKQALCPYCPVERDMDLDNIFHTTQDSLYMHHVCKDHGVYSTGYEMSPPLLAFENETPIAFCTECGETCKMVGLGSGVDNCMISYFRHAFISHNKKKQKRTREQKQSDHVFFNGARKRHIYENFEACVTNFRSTAEKAATTEPEDLLEEKYLEDVILDDLAMEIEEISDIDTDSQLLAKNTLFVTG